MGAWPLTGRDGDLAELTRLWPESRGLVIVGAPGVGKSRLAEEFVTSLDGRHQVVTGSVAAAGIPLGAVAGLVPEGVDLSDPVRCFAAVTVGLDTVGLDAAGLDAAGLNNSEWVFLVDDLHLLDATSVMLLRQLMDAGVIRIVGTVRADATTGTAFGALCGGDFVHRLDLAELDPEATGALLEAALDGPVDRQSVLLFHTMSGGNPLYLRELVRGAVGTGTLVRGGQVWGLVGPPPATPELRELVASRVAAAGPEARPVLELVALCEPVTLDDAQTLAPMELLARLADDGLLMSAMDGRRVVLSLAHPLYGEAVRAGIPARRRAEILLAQAERTEARGASRSEDAFRIANWRLAATGKADPTLLVQATALARHAGDYDQALQLAEAAWRQEQSTRTALGHATALVDLARHDDAERFLRDAETTVPDLDTAALFPTRVDNLVLQGSFAAAEQLLAGRADPVSRLALAAVRYFRGQVHDSADICQPLLDSDDPAIVQDTAVIAASALLRAARSAEAARVLEPLRNGTKPRANTLYANFIDDVDAYAYTLSGELATAERLLTALYEDAVAHRDTTAIARRATGLAYVLLDRGRPQTALRVLHPIVGTEAHWSVLAKWAHASAVTCAAMLGHTDFLAQYMAQPPDIGGDLESANTGIARAWYAVARGEPACNQLVAAADEARKMKQHLHSVWVVHAMGRLGLAALAEPYWDVPVEDEFLVARLDFTRAVHRKDADRLLKAAEIFQRADADLYAAEAFAQAAEVHRQAGRTRAATAATRQAIELLALCEGARTPALARLSPVRSPLTEREREIATLAAEGTSSRDIAATLHLSVRTVDNHLQKIYAKLGVETRRELAAALA